MDKNFDLSAWPSELKSSRRIASYMQHCSSEEIDTERVEENYFECHAFLRVIAIADIKEGRPEVNIPSRKKAVKYRALPLDDAPPILIMDGVIEDGNHRYRNARDRGATHILCYVIEALPEPEAVLQSGQIVRRPSS